MARHRAEARTGGSLPASSEPERQTEGKNAPGFRFQATRF